MPTAFIRHRVHDYETWRRVYDEFTRTNPSGVPVEPGVYRSVEDPNELLVVHEFGHRSEVEPWMQDAERRKAMAAAGVVGEPQVDIAYGES